MIHHPMTSAVPHPAPPPLPMGSQRNDLNALLRVRGMLAIDGAAFHALAAGSMSLRQSATESTANFVRRVTLAALDEAIEVAG